MMTQLGRTRIFWFVVFVVAALLLPGRGTAQNAVTPTLAPLPPGQLITVNNAPGDHFDPHVSGDLVAYSNLDSAGCQSIHYFNLATMSDARVPIDCTSQDFLSDVGGSVIAFTGVDPSKSAIFTFDSANPGAPPVELAPQANSSRQAAQVGDSTIAWQDYGFFNNGVASDIAAYDRASGTVTRLTSDGQLNELPGISPDGNVITWTDCRLTNACDIWSATGGGGNWTLHQLTNGDNGDGVCTHSDSDGQIVAYSCNRSGQDSIFWQPAGGGTEQVLNFAGSSIVPDVSGGLISFVNEAPGAVNHNLFVFDTSTTKLYQVTNGPVDSVLNDVSFTADGKVRVVWESNASGILAYTFNLPVGADLAITKSAPQNAVVGANIPYTITLTNNGPSTASSVVVTDAFPPGMTLVSCTPQDGTCGGTSTVSTITFNSVASGATESISLVVTLAASLPAGTVLGNGVIVSASTPDPNPNNNSGAATTTLIYNVCLLYNPTKSVKSGATIPIKLELCDANGSDLSNSAAVLHAVGVTMVSSGASAALEDVGNANPDNDFRFDSTLGTAGGYIFNLGTSGLAGTYSLNFYAGIDPTLHSVLFQVHP